MKSIIAILAGYTTAFIVTYGHAFNYIDSTFAPEKTIGAFISAVFWPMYWSVQLWK